MKSISEVKFMSNLRKYFPRILLLDTVILVIAATLAAMILNAFGMKFRKWVIILVLLLTAIGFVSGAIQLLLKIRRPAVRIGFVSLFAVITIAVGIAAAPLALFAFAGEEHVVERDGAKYVAHVNGWLDTYVYYFEYKSFLTEGSVKRIEEYYGDGGFDPIGSEHEYTVVRTIYYDEAGNILSVVEDADEN